MVTGKRSIDKDGAFTHIYDDNGKYLTRYGWGKHTNEDNIQRYYFEHQEEEKIKAHRQVHPTYEKSKFTPDQNSQYTYVCRDGNDGHIFTVTSPYLLQMPRGSKNREMLYNAITQKYQDYRLNEANLQLLMTYNGLTGDRIYGGF